MIPQRSNILLLFQLYFSVPWIRGDQPQIDRSISDPSQIMGFPITRIYLATPEELPLGSSIVDLANQTPVKNLLSNFPSTNSLDTFQFRLMNTFDSHLFRVRSRTGQLSAATRLDREALCASQKAQFCCNARSQIPDAIIPSTDWLKSDRAQLCHLVAHVSLQPQNDISTGGNTLDTDVNRLAMIYVYIRLDDINDHTPQFITPQASINVPEDTPVGSVLHYFRIQDPDAPPNGLEKVTITVVPLSANTRKPTTHSPTILTSEAAVSVNPFETQITKDGASLNLQQPLDRETVSAYDVTVLAIDGDPVKPRSSQFNMRVFVTDINDNSPVWVLDEDGKKDTPGYIGHMGQMQIFNVSVPEDTQIGALIYWLQARDADIGDNGRLHYAIDTSAPGGMTALDYFTVQSTTGEVRLRTQLDYDSTSMHMRSPEIEVPLVVRDSARTARQLNARATLYIRILDVNDNSPNIIASPLTPSINPRQPSIVQQTAFSLWENQPPGQPIASILVTDPDTGDGGRVTCSMRSDYFALRDEFGQSNVFPTPQQDGKLDGSWDLNGMTGPISYQLVSTKSLDREHMARHQVLITCRDHDTIRPLLSTKRLEIEVLDENDNSPTFETTPISFQCMENSPPGAVIGYLNASDADEANNAKLRFWSDEASRSWISVHGQTGEVRVNTLFDREVEQHRQFVAYVADGNGPEAHTVSTTVVVEILDENDHAPHFSDVYFFSIPENSPPGTKVGQVQAEDEDSGENGKIHYILRHPSKQFDLDRTSGTIRVRGDRNDLHAASNATPSFTLLDREQQDTYELTVIAEDCGSPAKRSTTVVHISLADVNDHVPVFRYPTPHGAGSVLNVSCIQLTSQIIARVYANDSDAGQNGEIEYSLIRRPIQRNKRESGQYNATNAVPSLNETKGNKTGSQNTLTRFVKSTPTDSELLLGLATENHFEINNYNGQLFLIHPILDCSQPTDVRLVIKAQDCGTPPKSATAVLTIHIQSTEQSDSGAPNSQELWDKSTQVFRPANAFAGEHRDLWAKRSRKHDGPGSEQPSLLLFGSTHWSAIIGLVVAMVILVVLLCLMLVVLRRRFLLDDSKLTRKNSHSEHSLECSNSIHTLRKHTSSDASPPYFKPATHSLRELHASSPMHSTSLSPTLRTREDQSSYHTLSINPHTTNGNTRYFCTLPPNAVTLNSGEVAILNNEAMRTRGTMGTLDMSPTRVMYKVSNGYPETAEPSDGSKSGGTKYQQTSWFTQRTRDPVMRHVWRSDEQYDCCNHENPKTSKLNHHRAAYTPLLDKDVGKIEGRSDEQTVFYSCDRTALSMNPEKIELLPGTCHGGKFCPIGMEEDDFRDQDVSKTRADSGTSPATAARSSASFV